MSRTSAVAAVSFFVAVLLAAPSVFAAAPTVIFDAPHGGEVYAPGQVQRVLLGDKTRAVFVSIELSRDGGATWELLGTIDNTAKNKAARNTLAFTVAGPQSSNCVMRATGMIGLASAIVLSSPFSIGSAGIPLPGSVTSGSLAPGSVTAPAIANGAVTSANIADGAVGVQQISSGAAPADSVLQADGSGGAAFGPLPLDSRYVKIAGDTMKGSLTLSGDPTARLHAATKQYVDAQAGAVSGVGPKTGNSIIGALDNAATTRGTLSADLLVGTAGIDITGNAATATTAGSAPPRGPAGGDLSGSYPNPSVASVGGQTAGSIASGVQAANNATAANTASTVVKRDGSGDFAVGTVTGTLNGNAATATNAGSFTGPLAGDVTGTQSATVVSGVGGQTAANVASGVQAANNATDANTASTIVKRDASGGLSAGTITANLSGNASTATNASQLNGQPASFYQDADNLATGTLADARLSGNVTLQGNTFNQANKLVQLDGTARLPAVDASQALNLNASNIGSGTVRSANLPIAGTTAGTRGAVYADNATVLLAADGKLSLPSGSIMPAGFFILGDTATAPTGFTFTGQRIESSWVVRANMPTPRGFLCACSVNGRIYAMGGYTVGSVRVAVNEVYDPTTNQWTTKAPMSGPRVWFGACVVNGIIYVAGGDSDTAPYLTTFEEYDPATDTWSTRAPMPTGRQSLVLCEAGGKVYAIGGTNAGDPLTVVEEYDPATRTWATRAPMPTGRADAAAASVNGRIYVCGGNTGTGTTAVNEEYDPALNTWSTKAAMPTALYSHAAASLNGKVYVLGGGANPQTSVDEYDPSTDSWQPKVPMLNGRVYLAAVGVNGCLYALGGYGTNGSVPASVEAYGVTTFYVYRKN